MPKIKIKEFFNTNLQALEEDINKWFEPNFPKFISFNISGHFHCIIVYYYEE